MRLLQFLYCLFYFLLFGLCSVPTSAETVGNTKINFTSQTELSEHSESSRVDFVFNNYSVIQLSDYTRVIKIRSDKKKVFLKYKKANLVSSEEIKWLSLLYLDEKSKLATHPNRTVLSQENQMVFKNTDLVDAWKALDNIGVDDAIRKNPSYLKNVDDYAKRSGKSADEVADLAKNNENGIEQFLDELEDTPASGHWDKNPFQRGKDIEDDLGQNLPETFKTIDKYDDVTGEVTSIKSLDLDAKTYQTPSKLRSRLNKHLDELDDFDGYQLEGVEIGDIESPINSKTLELAIPRAATGEQLNVLNELVSNGASKSINVKIVEFP